MSQEAEPRVTIDVRDGVADVRLNRPEKLNALDPAMFAALGAAGDQLAEDRTVRAVVLSGEGRGFCAGLDFTSFQTMAGERPGGAARPDAGPNAGAGSGTREPSVVTEVTGGAGEARKRGLGNRGQHAVWVWAELPMPVIAAIHGVALGGGLQIALGADLRIVAPDARLSVLEIRWGLIPDMTGTYVLPRLVGLDVAKELTWSGRMVDGEEAVRIGLATRVADDPRQEALSLASTIATGSPNAIRASKALLQASLDRGPGEQFAEEERAISGLIGSPNQAEAVQAYFEKRPPIYADPD